MKTIADLEARLGELHERTRETPLFNPVFQLSLDLSRALEGGELSLDDMTAMVAELECDGLKSRARKLQTLLVPPPTGTAPMASEGEDFEAFRTRWERPQLHAVFTAHPTFLLTPAQAEAVADTASAAGKIDEAACIGAAERASVTLAHEHRAAIAAMGRAQDARDAIVARLLGEARGRWPDQWRTLRPLPFRFASWVGYDMDGRTDIGWHTSIGFRLSEKAERLARYTANLETIDPAHPLLETLRPATYFAEERANDFAGDLSGGDALAVAANRLTTHSPNNLLSLSPLITVLEGEADTAAPDRAVALLTLAAAMRADGLGMGWIHFRVNAKQLHNAIRRRLDDGEVIELASKSALVTLRAMVDEAKPLRTNFAALATESSTAIRQFIAMAQIIKHIDADAPIRMLVAECEQPATVLAALYFAKLFGVEDKVDVSPLFETEAALEHGGRFLDALLAELAYRTYARNRGRVAVQTGFSDAGRFVGQIPASLAIERLQGRLAEAMAANGLGDVAALVFNTHGESMGRGAHPANFRDRLEWPMSPWARRRFARAGIRLEPEVSFQGGDGYLFFATSQLALATLTRIADLRPAETDLAAPADPFYHRTDISLDFYRAIKEHQGDHLVSRTYVRAVTAFGLGLLNPTGSRVSRRQSDINADREMSLRQIRAIPHNAILQQLGYPVNVLAGIGSAADTNREEIAALLTDSARGRQILRLVRAANALASIKTVAAFGELFNSAYWASRTYRGTEDHLAGACAALAEYLVGDDRTGVFRRLASRLRIDALKLHRLTDLIPDDAPDGATALGREHVRRRIGVLQALRLALLQHMFLKIVSVPAFSRANDISRGDVIEMVLTLRVEEALAQLRRAFPVRVPGPRDFPLDEASDYPDGGEEGYGAIERDCLTPIARAHALSLRISTAIANEFGAHG